MQDQDLALSPLDDPDSLDPSSQSGAAVSILLPNLSILGVGDGHHSSQADTPPPTSCDELSASPGTSACVFSSLSHSSAQGKSLIFDLEALVSHAD
jgi:hypothetical protein